MKKCSKCMVIQQNVDFHKNPKSKDGLQSNCKGCQKKSCRRYTKNNHAKNEDFNELPNERWRFITRFYMVSDHGRFYRMEHIKNGRRSRGKFLEGAKMSIGYNLVGLGAMGRVLAHRVVAKYFCDNPNQYRMVNHKDSDRLNNHYSNLEWCTQQQNNTHATNKGRMGKKLTIEKVKDIKSSKLSVKELADKYDVTTTNIKYILNGKIWKSA